MSLNSIRCRFYTDNSSRSFYKSARPSANEVTQPVFGVPGLSWSIKTYPDGRNNDNVPQITIRINDAGNVAYRIENPRDSDIPFTTTFERVFVEGKEYGFKFPNDDNSGPSIDILAVIICTATFEPKIPKIPTPRLFELVDDSKPHCHDAEVVVGTERLKVHRGFLSMISPVFHAAFTHKTKEAETGIIEIEDFDFETVKSAIDYLFGHDIDTKSAVEVVDILRFFDKYNIEPAMAILEKWLNDNLNHQTFAGIAKYAWQFDRQELQEKCGRFYHNNVQTINANPDFVKLQPTIIAGVLSAAFAFTGIQ